MLQKILPKKEHSTNLPDPKLQLQRHSLVLEHCNQTGQDHPSRIKRNNLHRNRINTTESVINCQEKYLDNGGIIVDFIVETTRWRFVVLRESTSKNLYQVRSMLEKEKEYPMKSIVQTTKSIFALCFTCEEEPRLLEPRQITSRLFSFLRFSLSW